MRFSDFLKKNSFGLGTDKYGNRNPSYGIIDDITNWEFGIEVNDLKAWAGERIKEIEEHKPKVIFDKKERLIKMEAQLELLRELMGEKE